MHSRHGVVVGLGVLVLMTVAAAFAQSPPSGGHTPKLLLTLMSDAAARLTVTAASFKDGDEIPKQNTQYGGNQFPGLSWSRGPTGTQSYVVIMQGQSLERPSSVTSIHLFLFNLPATLTRLDPGLKTVPSGASAGPNLHSGGEVYVGPHTHTAEKHSYHFQVLALDTVLRPATPISFDSIADAMKGHVQASGEVVGWAAKTDDEQ